MAPAVSWKSSSCCRNRMACRGRTGQEPSDQNIIEIVHIDAASTGWLLRRRRVPMVTGRMFSGFETHVTGELVDRSVFGHVVLFIRVVLSENRTQ